MNQRDWQNAFGPAPDDFRARVDETLNRLEEREMRRSIKFSTSLVAAALVVVLLAGAALAASQLNIWEALNTADPIIPLEGADDLVATNLATAENDYFRVTVQEGVYDGFGAIVKLRFEPTNPEKYVLLAGVAHPADVGDEYITEVIKEYDDGLVDERIVGRKDGKEIIFLSTPDLVIDSEIPNAEALGLDMMFNSYQEKYFDDGSVEYWIDGLFAADLPDTLGVTLNVRGMDGEHSDAYGKIENLNFSLIKNNKERVVKLTPVGENKIEGFELVDAKITFTEVRGYIAVEFTGSAEEQDMGISLRLLDENGTEFTTGSGQCMQLENGHYRWEMEMQSFAEIPETMIIEAHIIGESTLGQIECTVEEIVR